MFEELIRELERLGRGVTVRIPVEPDSEGFFDRECPSPKCRFQFKVQGDDWAALFRDEVVFCPYCRHEAPADHWWTTEQVEHAREEALEYLKGRISDAARRSAQRFNRSQPRDGFIKMSMEFRGSRSRRSMVPIEQSEPLELKIQCEKCSARFSVVGSAFFCPACGYNSADRTFRDAVEKVRAKVRGLSQIRTAYAAMGKSDG